MTTAVYLVPDPAAGTGIQLLTLCDNSPGAVSDSVTALTSESQDSATEITDHPVEDGGTISDNAREQPESIEFQFSVALSPSSAQSNRADLLHVTLDIPTAPLNIFSTSALASAAIGAIGDALFGAKPTPSITGPVFFDFDPVSEMSLALAAIKGAKARCTVVHSAGTLYDMLITKIGRVRTDRGGAKFTVQLRQVFTVSSATVDAPSPLEPRGQPAVSKGAQTPAPAPPATAQKGDPLYNIFHPGG